MTTYPVSQNLRTQEGAINESNRCPKCKRINKRKRLVQCDSCGAWYHLSCVGLTRIRILPKGVLIPFDDAHVKTLRETIEQKTLEKWGRLLCFWYWSLQRLELSIGTRQPSLTTKVKQQLTDFIELSGIPRSSPKRQFTNNNIKIDEHHYGKRVAAKFADGDIRESVREIFSSDNLEIHNEETLAALIAHHPPAPPNLLLPPP
ncbi:hypothetical protein GJ496_007388 [Pomphorhynchus laevis]|nr:hypothetical protein GJ496_007388 [Pomphorhynchus laevis]